MSAVLESSAINAVLANLPTSTSKGKNRSKKRSETASKQAVDKPIQADQPTIQEKPQTVPHPSVDNLDAKGKAQRDQLLATERDKLIDKGFSLAGIGLTIDRVDYGNDLIKYARIMAHHCRAKSDAHMWSSIETIAKGINTKGHGQASDYREIYEFVDMAILASFIPDVKSLNYSIARMFLRFVGKKSLTLPEMKELDKGKELAAKIVKRDVSMLTKITNNRKESFIDRKAVKNAIDAILGKRKGPEGAGDDEDTGDDEETGEKGVTSVHAVANWLKAADSAKLEELVKLLGKETTRAVGVKLVSAI